MRKTIIGGICILLAFFLSIPPACAAAPLKITAVFPTWEPYGFVSDDGSAAGFEIETFEAVMSGMNIGVEFVHQPWKRCLYSVKNGLADVVISALKVEERKAYLHYPEEPISISRTAFFTLVDSKVVFDGSYENFKGRTISVTAGFSYGADFDACDFLKIDENTETHGVVLKVLLRRTDIGVGNIPVIRTIAQKSDALSKIKFLKPLLHSQELYVGFSKANGHELLTQNFSKALNAFKQTAEYEIIIKKYNMNY
jgi:polar amino acid transport system substrate-binding protein